MIPTVLVNILGALLFLFPFWRRLKDDYASEIIYAAGFYVLTGIVLTFFVSRQIAPSWWFWFTTTGAAAGFLIGLLKFHLRFYEALEAFFVGLLSWLLLNFLWHATAYASISSLIGGLVIVFILALFAFLDSRYKRFTWYVSGRVGFAGLTSLGVFFLTRALVASYLDSVLSLSGDWDAILSAIVGFVAFLSVYNLSRRSI